MAYELFFATGAIISAASLIIFLYRGRRMTQVFAQERRLFGYVLLLTALGFGIFAVSEILELLELATPLIEEIDELNLVAGFILLLSQLLLLVSLVRIK